MKTKTRALILVLCMLCVLGGCQSQEQGYILKTTAEEVPAGVYIYWQVLSTREALYQVPEDTTVETLWKQNIDEKPIEQWIGDQALENTRRLLAVESLFDEMGLELDAATRTEIENWTETQWDSLGTAHERNGIAKSSFYRVNEGIEKQQALFLALYGAEGSEAILAEEMAAHLTEDYVRFSYMHFTKQAGDTAAEDEAQAYYDRAVGSEDFYDLMDEKNGVEREAGEARNENDYYYIANRDYYGTFPAELIEAMYDTAIDDVGIFDNDSYIFVFVRQDPTRSPEDMQELDYTLRYALREEQFDQLLDARVASLAPSVSDAAIKKYAPSKLNLSSV